MEYRLIKLQSSKPHTSSEGFTLDSGTTYLTPSVPFGALTYTLPPLEEMHRQPCFSTWAEYLVISTGSKASSLDNLTTRISPLVEDSIS